MARFRYQAMTHAGDLLSGVVEAPSAAAVHALLRNQGHYPLAADDCSEKRLLGSWPAAKPTDGDLAMAAQSLAMLLEAGLDVERALEVLIGLKEIRRLRQPLAAALARLRDGASLADALGAEPTLPRLVVGMVRAGEIGGSLEPTLRRLSEQLIRAHALRQAIISALIYPAILMVTAVISVTVILVFVLPEFAPLFEGAGKQPPAAMAVLLAAGEAIGRHGWSALVLLVAAAAGLRVWLRRPEPRRHLHRRLLALPLIGPLLTEIDMERFGRTLGSLLSSGIALPAALLMTRDALANAALAEAVGETAARLREGEGLAERLARYGLFSALALDLIRVGEETSRLDEMLLRQAALSERSVRLTLDRLLALLVPGMTLVLGLVVAGIIASLLTAILGINDLALG